MYCFALMWQILFHLNENTSLGYSLTCSENKFYLYLISVLGSRVCMLKQEVAKPFASTFQFYNYHVGWEKKKIPFQMRLQRWAQIFSLVRKFKILVKYLVCLNVIFAVQESMLDPPAPLDPILAQKIGINFGSSLNEIYVTLPLVDILGLSPLLSL